MSSEGKAPDLVRRAAARLSGATERKAPTFDNNLVRAAESSAHPAPGAGLLREPAPGAGPLGEEEPQRERPAQTTTTSTQGRHVNVSPTSLAANGISLPSAGF